MSLRSYSVPYAFMNYNQNMETGRTRKEILMAECLDVSVSMVSSTKIDIAL
jgi:hypothetical protein